MKTSTKRIELPKKRTDNGHPRLEGRPSEMSPEGKLELRSILVPVDFSRPSLKALKYAAAFAERFDAKITLLHVVEPLGLPDFAATSPLVIENEKLVRMAEDKLRGLPDRCDVSKAIVEKTLVRTGKAYHEIAEAARTLKVDLIIIASHAHGGVKRINLGSVTDYLIRNAGIPTLVVRPTHPADGGNGLFERIVVPLDGSPLAEQIISHVKELTTDSRASVTLVRVLQPVTYSQKQIMQPGLPWWDDAMAEAESYLDRAAGLFGDAGLSVTKEVLMADDVALAILQHSATSGADLLAIATRGVGGIKRLMFGTIADELTRRSPISVLVFHPREAAG